MVSKHSKAKGDDFNRFINRLSKQELTELLEKLHTKRRVSFGDVEQLTKEQGLMIPCAIFTKRLSTFESICKHLKESKGLTYHQIAVLLKRDDRTIWTVYNNAIKKEKKKIIFKDSELQIPISIFEDRRLSILEHIVRYLKENHGMRYNAIADLLKRDDRTIWTVYHRGLKKVKQ